MNTFVKTDQEIKNQIINWFLKYYRKTIGEFTGHELFTIFDKLTLDAKINLSRHLITNEIAVLVLKVEKANVIICTTRRFIHINNNEVTELKYKDFDDHIGYKSIAITGHSETAIGVKTDGYIADFGLGTKNGQKIYWKIPTGHSGFAFWNITRKFELIGRKFNADENK